MMQPVRQGVSRGISMLVALGIATALIGALPASAGGSLAAITGNVHDVAGMPLTGALVIIASSAPSAPQHMVLTDQRGSFSFPSLFPGEYSVRVTMPKFLPATKSGIQLTTGGTTILTVNLQTAMDVVRRALAGQRTQTEDVVWTLRSSRSSQPLLHLRAETNASAEDRESVSDPYSGNFELYSESVDTPAGTGEGKGSQFSVTVPLDSKSKITVAGLYSDSASQPKGFGARYEYSPSARRHSAIDIGLKQGILLSNSPDAATARDLQIDYREDLQWSDHLVFNYGTTMGRTGALNEQNYLRPRLGVSWVPQRRTTISVTATSEAPAMAGDPSRDQEYLGRSIYIFPGEQHYSHNEVAVSHVLSDHTEFGAAIFRDRADTEALFFSSAEGSGVLILDTSHNPSQGGRIYLNRRFLRSFEAGAGYTAATGISLPESNALSDLSRQLENHRVQVVTTRFKADVDSTQTEVTAVYRWMSSFSASPIDPYQHSSEYNDPALSLTVAQNLPTWRMFPGRLQAILDARNLLDHPFGPLNVQLAQSPRFLKGGINIKF